MAGTNSLGRLTLDLVVKAGAFTAGMTAAERQANKSLSAIEKRAYKFGQAVGTSIKAGAVLAVAALGTIALAVGQAIDKADEMRDLSNRTGIATEKLSEYAYAAKQTGTDIDGLGRGLKILSKNLAEAADPKSGKGKLFEALGVGVKDAQGNLKQLDAILPEIANKFKLMEDGTTKAALAQELFGKSGVDLIEFLNQGAVGLEEMGAKAKELGIIISTETAAAADEFNDRLGDLRAQVDGLSLQIAAGLLPKLNDTTSEFGQLVKQGDTAANVVSLLNSVIDFGVGIIKTYNDAVARTALDFELAAKAGAGLLEIQKNVATLGYADGSVADGVKKIGKAWDENGEAIKRLNEEQRKAARLAEVVALTAGQYTDSNVRRRGGGMSVDQLRANAKDRVEAEATAKRLASMFGGGGSGAKGKSGKSEAEKEADKLKAAYDRMNESLTEQIGTFGLVGEAAKLRYELEHGELSKLTDAEKESLIVKAEKLDAMNLEKELQDAAAKASEDEYKRITDGIKATDEFIDQLKFELDLMGMSNIEREKAIALRHLDANATDEQRAAVASLTEELIRASENQAFIDDFKDGLADMFVDFASGAKSAKEAFGDFADELFNRALQFVADKAIDAMFDAFNGDGKIGGQDSSGGGMWANIFGAFAGAFGGGKAGGGSVLPGKFYRVNESGMEGLTVNGKDYLMTGSESGVVTPAHRMGGGGVSQNNKFIFAAPTSQRTQEQVAQRSAFELSRAQRRNG